MSLLDANRHLRPGRARVKLPILVYHKIDRIPPGSRYPRNYVTPEQFDAQLAFLQRAGYRSV